MRIIPSTEVHSMRTALTLLSKRDKHKVFFVSILQVALGFLDLAGVAIIGILGALSVTGIQSESPGERVSWVLETLRISEFSFQKQVGILGALAALFLFGRTLLSVYFTRRTLFFLSSRGSKASSELISKVLSRPLIDIQRRSSQETLWAVTNGVSTLMLGVVGVFITLVADISLLIVVTAGLFVIDAKMAIGMLIVFSFAAGLLYILLSHRARILGRKNAEYSIKSNEKILEVLRTYRESVVRNRREFYSREIGKIRYQLGDVLAENAFMPYIGKYVIESTVVFGALALSAYQFITNDAAHAVSTMVVFMAAATRIGPAVLRIQQGSITIKGSISAAQPTLNLISEVEEVKLLQKVEDFPIRHHEGFRSAVFMRDVSFRYPNAEVNALSNITFELSHGQAVAVVGSSGAGKTTLVDVLLGVIKPDSGSVQIGSLSPADAITQWPGAIAYVPQDVAVVAGTIKSNVCLGFPTENVNDEDIWEAIRSAHLEDFVNGLPHGLQSDVGEAGIKMSGGQRQRLGIARALFTNPMLIILDEATSSLDGETEAYIAKSISSLKGKVTVVTIAHRLSTIRESDVVVYMSQGRIECIGSFEQLRIEVPNFDKQAKLMGL